MNKICKGKVLYADADGGLYISRNQRIFYRRSEDERWKKLCKLPSGWLRSISGLTRLSSRLLRNEVRAFLPVSDSGYCAINRETVFHIADNGKTVIPAEFQTEGPKVEPAINLEKGPNGEVLFGEYFNNVERRPVRIMVSRDKGRNFQVAYTFGAGEIRHVHHIRWDVHAEHYWVLVGDHRKEPGIVALNEDFNMIRWLARGDQKFRAVQAFIQRDFLLYSMDTEMEDNFIVRLNKQDGQVEVLQAVDGSCLHATQCKDYFVLSTCIEPLDDPENTSETRSSIWVSKDGIQWKRILSFSKDIWDHRYFQFGTVILPQGMAKGNDLYFSGQALMGVDNEIYKIDLDKYWKAN